MVAGRRPHGGRTPWKVSGAPLTLFAMRSTSGEDSTIRRSAHHETNECHEQRRQQLLRRYARYRDRHDLECLVVAFRPLARGLARRYSNASRPSEDLEQVAYEGLIKAIQRFDPDRGTPFASFAVPTVLGELRRFIRDTAWPAHVPRPLQELVREVRAAATSFSSQYRRTPTARDLARYMSRELEDVIEALQVTTSLSVASLDATASAGDDEVYSHAERIGAEDDGFERVEYLTAIEQVLPALTAGQREALRLHFGEELSSGQIARRLGVSRSDASRDLDRAVATLRQLEAA
jgi:RNA polymerase sigma-B factor